MDMNELWIKLQEVRESADYIEDCVEGALREGDNFSLALGTIDPLIAQVQELQDLMIKLAAERAGTVGEETENEQIPTKS